MTRLAPGDWLILAAGAALTVTLAARALDTPGARVEIRVDGRHYATLPLTRDRVLEVPGALGPARVEIRAGRTRVAADPSPRQVCVQQGWLARAGETALCLPNRISVAVLGADTAHDSLAY